MRFLVSWLILGLLLLLQARSIRALDDVESNGTVPLRSDNGFLTSVEDRTPSSLEFVLDTGVTTSPEDSRITNNVSTERRAPESFSFDGKLDREVATFPEDPFGSVRMSKGMGIVVRQPLSQSRQDPNDFHARRAEISPSGLSDLRRRAGEGEAKAQY